MNRPTAFTVAGLASTPLPTRKHHAPQGMFTAAVQSAVRVFMAASPSSRAFVALGVFRSAWTSAGAGEAARGEGETSIQIDAAAPRVAVNPRMYGIFFEEINHAGDGGLYAELVQNRDFEAHNAPGRRPVQRQCHGHAQGLGRAGLVQHRRPRLDARGRRGRQGLDPPGRRVAAELRESALDAAGRPQVGDRLGVANAGYWGMNFREGALYDLSFYARTEGERDVRPGGLAGKLDRAQDLRARPSPAWAAGGSGTSARSRPTRPTRRAGW